MPRATHALAAACVITLAVGAPTSGVVMGGGSVLTDCYVVLDGATVNRGHNKIECLDGSDCDADQGSDTVCSFDVRVCTNFQTEDLACRPNRRVVSLTVEGALLDLPRIPSRRPACGNATRLTVPLRRKSGGRFRKGKLRLKMRAVRLGKPTTDRDKVTFYCLPNPCPENPNAANGLSLALGSSGSDVDLGWSGAGHNLRLPLRNSSSYCLTDCEGDDRECVGRLNPLYSAGPLALGPVPILVAGTALCVQSTFTLPATIQTAATTGSVDGVGRLEAAGFVTTPSAICPRCVDNGDGTGATICDSGPRQGSPCALTGLLTVPGADGDPTYPVSADCPPVTDFLAARVAADIALTTGAATLPAPGPCPGSDGLPLPDDACADDGCGGACICLSDDPTKCLAAAGGVHQTCCMSDATHACFPTGPPASQSISRVGIPVPLPVPLPDELFPSRSAFGAVVGTTCLAAEPAGVPLVSGLDGPAAVALPVGAFWLP